MVAKEITLVRHGETTANAAGVWQGSTNSLLSGRGQQQAAEAGARLQREAFDLVVSSDLGRTQQTATAIGFSFELDPRWRELQLGAWEGMTRAEIIATYPEEAAAFWTGQDMSIDGSETIGELTIRVGDALDSIEARLPDGGRALVVTHGGPIFGIVAEILGISSPPPLSGVANTSLTRLQLNESHREVAVYNDFGHLADRAARSRGRHPDRPDSPRANQGQSGAVAGRGNPTGDSPTTAFSKPNFSPPDSRGSTPSTRRR